MEPITTGLFVLGKVILTALSHSAAAHTAVVHTAAVASHGVTTAKGAAIISHSTPAVHHLTTSTLATAHSQGAMPAIKEAATLCAEVGTAAGVAYAASEAIEAIRAHKYPKGALSAVDAANEVLGLTDAAW